jgi:hypothetical protein
MRCETKSNMNAPNKTKWHCHCEQCGRDSEITLPNPCPHCDAPEGAVVGDPVGGWEAFEKSIRVADLAKALKATGKPRVTIIRGKSKTPRNRI